jgi:hypothetical protein
MTPLKILKAARAKIEKPENWTQGAGARDANGFAISVHSDLAVSWCIGGAIVASAACDPSNEIEAANILQRAILGGSIPEFNDAPKRKHKEVLAAFDIAIAMAAEQEKQGAEA